MKEGAILSYDVEELFKFYEFGDEYAGIEEYLKKDDPTITELEIPAEYNGRRVIRIYKHSFRGSKYLKRVVIPPSVNEIYKYAFSICERLETVELSEGLKAIYDYAFCSARLKSVVLPKSLETLWHHAFFDCRELESVTFNSAPVFGDYVFVNCPKLPADKALMGLVHSCDLSKPFIKSEYNWAFEHYEANRLAYIRPDVLELAIKNDCFRSVDVSVLLKYLLKTANTESLNVVEECGLFKSGEHVDECIEASVRRGTTELTAYFLELKKRKFGFKKDGEFDL